MVPGHTHKTVAEGVPVRLLAQPGVEGHNTLSSDRASVIQAILACASRSSKLPIVIAGELTCRVDLLLRYIDLHRRSHLADLDQSLD
jgi:hypothetical protein